MIRAELTGKSRDEIAAALKHKRHGQLIDLIADLVTLETFFTPEEIARARKIGARAIKAMIKAGQIRAHKPLANGYRVPRSAVDEWDAKTALRRASTT